MFNFLSENPINVIKKVAIYFKNKPITMILFLMLLSDFVYIIQYIILGKLHKVILEILLSLILLDIWKRYDSYIGN